MKYSPGLSRQESLWVEEIIRQLCALHNVRALDEDYHAAAWAAFWSAFCNFYNISSPDFWPYAYRQINTALRREKQRRSEQIYRLLSLDAPAAPNTGETFLDRLPARQGDFTESVAFWDFLNHLPQGPAQLAARLVNQDSMEEARSFLGLTDQELCQTVVQLREALTRYQNI